MPDARITPDEFLAWREDPVTMWVFDALEARAQDNEGIWADTLSGIPGPDQLFRRAIELRARIDTARDIKECEYQDYCKVLNEEPTAE